MEERDQGRPRLGPHGVDEAASKKDGADAFTLTDEPFVERPAGRPRPGEPAFLSGLDAAPEVLRPQPRPTPGSPSFAEPAPAGFEARKLAPEPRAVDRLPDWSQEPFEAHPARIHAIPGKDPVLDPTAGPHEVRRPAGQPKPGPIFPPASEPVAARPADTHVKPNGAGPPPWSTGAAEIRSAASRPARAPLPDFSQQPAEVRRTPASLGAPKDPNFLDATRDIEVRKDQAAKSELPPLSFDPGQIEVEADAGRSRVRVMTTGVFDLIHLGHIHMLEAARKLGDELVVVIARDETVRRMKHDPINNEEVRRQIVSSLRPVTKAVLGHHGDIYRIVEELQPDIVALGYDQKFTDDEVRSKCLDHGVDVQVVRLPQFDHDLDATRKIIDRIAERWGKKELYTSREG